MSAENVLMNITFDAIFAPFSCFLQIILNAAPSIATIANEILFVIISFSVRRNGLSKSAIAERTAEIESRTEAMSSLVFFLIRQAVKTAADIYTKNSLILPRSII